MIKLVRTQALGFRLTGAFILMAAIVGVTGAFGIFSINRVVTQVVSMMRAGAAQEKVVLEIELDQKACRVNLVEGALVLKDAGKFATYVDNYRKKRTMLRKNVALLLDGDEKLGIPPGRGGEIEKRAKGVLSSWREFEAVADELIARKSGLLKGVNAGGAQAAMRALADEELNNLAVGKIMESSENAKADIDDLADYIESMMVKSVLEALNIRRAAVITFVSVILGAVVTAILLGIFIARGIAARLGRITEACSRGAEGDLTVSVAADSWDELGLLGGDFNRMTEKLAGMVAKVNVATGELTTVSHDIAAASNKVSETAQRQASGVSTTSSAIAQIDATLKEVSAETDSLALHAEEGSASILEMSATIDEVALNSETLAESVHEVSSSIIRIADSIKEVSESVAVLGKVTAATASSVAEMESAIGSVQGNALETSALSESVGSHALAGKTAVAETIAGMEEIRASSRITHEVIGNLSGRAKDIGAILSIIDEVAAQTNLLALNAAIIAAQAGEHGSGFAVVADEIKNLASRTKGSTGEIAAVIRGVQDEIRRASEAMERTERCIEEGQHLSRRSGTALDMIVASAQRSVDQVSLIARATAEQALGGRTIRESTEQVAAMVTQISGATVEQREEAERIIKSVQQMRTLNGQVVNAIREQSKAGAHIARSTTSMTGMIQQIRRACGEQSRGSMQIVSAMGDIQDSATVNLEVISVMERAVRHLLAQVETLHTELAKFSVECAPAEPAAVTDEGDGEPRGILQALWRKGEAV